MGQQYGCCTKEFEYEIGRQDKKELRDFINNNEVFTACATQWGFGMYVHMEQMIWSKDRCSNQFDRVVPTCNFSQEEWKENFRMNPMTF